MEAKNAGKKIGVFVCDCGANIAGKLNVPEVAEFASSLPGVAVCKEYRFMCSDPGQDLIKNDIKEQGLNAVVVAACSPRMHENTFRKACEAAGLNRYLFFMTNIREQCSWVHEDARDATQKAKALVSGAVRRTAFLAPLEMKKVKINPSTLIVGGGIAGIQAAIDLAEGGNHVYLVEKKPSIGGHMSQLDKTFPTLDCSA